MNRVYMAGPLFSRAERDWNSWIARRLANWDCELPQNFVDPTLHPTDIAELCLNKLEACDVVLACLDGADADSGTCFELGFAYAKNIPIVGYRTDFRGTGDAGYVNAMLTLCKHLLIVKDTNDILEKINTALHEVTRWPLKSLP